MANDGDNYTNGIRTKRQKRSANDVLDGLDLTDTTNLTAEYAKTHNGKRTVTSTIRFWFWGTIIVLAVATISLVIVAEYRTNTENKKITSVEDPSSQDTVVVEGPPIPLPKELSATELRDKFNFATNVAYEHALGRVDELLAEAYAPVLQAIPGYIDFHYSVWGSYAELGDAAFGDPEQQVKTRILAGFDDRIKNAIQQIDQAYEQKFMEVLDADFNRLVVTVPNLGPLTKIIFEDVALQTGGALAATGSVLATKGLAKGIVQKISTTIAAKAGLKLGSKWASSLAGAGSGALACSWAGPGAGACALAGGVIFWFTSDAVITKLDEIYTRDEFEADILQKVNQSRKELFANIEENLLFKATKQRTEIQQKTQEFTLQQLSEIELKELCKRANDLLVSYVEFSQNHTKRSKNTLDTLFRNAEKSTDFLGLSEFSNEILNNLVVHDETISITPLKLGFNLPEDFQSSHSISGTLQINTRKYDFSSAEPFDSRNVTLVVENGDNKVIKLRPSGNLRVTTTLEQDNWGWNDIFYRDMIVDVGLLLSNLKGTRTFIPVKLKVQGYDQLSINSKLEFGWSVNKLPPLEMFPKQCEG